jgi:hypothetical protein
VVAGGGLRLQASEAEEVEQGVHLLEEDVSLRGREKAYQVSPDRRPGQDHFQDQPGMADGLTQGGPGYFMVSGE